MAIQRHRDLEYNAGRWVGWRSVCCKSPLYYEDSIYKAWYCSVCDANCAANWQEVDGSNNEMLDIMK